LVPATPAHGTAILGALTGDGVDVVTRWPVYRADSARHGSCRTTRPGERRSTAIAPVRTRRWSVHSP